MTTPQQVLAIAKKEVDAQYKEGANNDTKFGTWAGAPHQPWCASYVSWCFHTAGAGNLIPSPRGFTNCNTGLAYYRTHDSIIPTRDANGGDIVFFNLDGNVGNGSEHVGIVYINQPDQSRMITFEGNTNNDGSANGDGCYKKTRPYAKVLAVARPKWSPTT